MEPAPGNLSGINLGVLGQEACCRAPYISLGFYPALISDVTLWFYIGWEIGNSSGIEGKSKRTFSVSTKELV